MSAPTQASSPSARFSSRRIQARTAVLSVLGALALTSLVAIVTGCGDDPTGTARVGRSLEIHLSEPVVAQKMTYKAGAEDRVIQAGASNRQLAMVKVTVVNRTSTVVLLVVDGDVAQIGDRRGQRIASLNPLIDYKTLDAPDPSAAEGFLPFLWGEIELSIGSQVEGWMVFEVPLGLRLGTFWWDEVDYIILDYPA